MKKLLLILLIFISLNVFSQIRVKENSFHQIDGFVMLDKTKHLDVNDAPMALIKISTENISAEQRRRITFKGNLATYFDVQFEPSEIYLYITAEAANFIEIHHPDYGKTEYWLPQTLKPYCGYEMVVQYVPLINNAEQNYLIIKTDQANADIYIDNEYVGKQFAHKQLIVGSSYNWRIECELYRTESGNITITNEENLVEVTMQPEYGFLNVTTSPENGALVYIDDVMVGGTPYKSDKLSVRDYTVKVEKDQFKTTEKLVTVNDKKTIDVNIEMLSIYVDVTINTDSNSEIFVNNEYKAKGKWNGKLLEGTYTFEARRKNYRTTQKIVTLVSGNKQTVKLDTPEAIYGSIEISSYPTGADVYIDGKHYGSTPIYIKEMLIGKHELKIDKDRYKLITKNVTIKENEILKINERLQPEKVSLDRYLSRGVKFITVNGAYSSAPQLSYGISFGSVKQVGWFVSAMSNFDFTGFDVIDKSHEEVILTGESRSTRLSVTGGVIARIGGPVYFKAGAGYGAIIRVAETIDGNYAEYKPDTFKGVDLTAGLQFNLRNITFGIDAVTTNFKMTEIKLGIGVNFN
ncbi:MAG: PEGA domain-containing protein [Bacteroidales bacterium]|nr:PEGA domain-containing protein [Bacteroidales bacterium]